MRAQAVWGVDHMRQDEEQNGFAALKKLKANFPIAHRGVDHLHHLDVLLVGKEREPESHRAGVSVEAAAYRDRSIFDRTGQSREPLPAHQHWGIYLVQRIHANR